MKNTDHRLHDRDKGRKARRTPRWFPVPVLPRQEWGAVAALYVVQQPGRQAIVWREASYRVDWVGLLGGNEAILGRDRMSKMLYRKVWEVTKDRRMVTVAHAIEWAMAGKGCLVHVSLFPEGHFDGRLPGVFQAGRGVETVS